MISFIEFNDNVKINNETLYITIPAKLAKKYGIKVGDAVKIRVSTLKEVET